LDSSGGPRRKRQSPERPGGGDLSRLSREELYQEAQKLDITGRSKMDRSELEQAVERATEQSVEQPAREGRQGNGRGDRRRAS
jgi:hypothetical protein